MARWREVKKMDVQQQVETQSPAMPVFSASGLPSTSTAYKLVVLAALVRQHGLRWRLEVPTDPSDAEWIVGLGDVDVVAGDLDDVLDIAIGELQKRPRPS